MSTVPTVSSLARACALTSGAGFHEALYEAVQRDHVVPASPPPTTEGDLYLWADQVDRSADVGAVVALKEGAGRACTC